MNIIPIQSVNVFLYKNSLFFVGNCGIVVLNVHQYLFCLKIIIHHNFIKLESISNDLSSENLKKLLLNEINNKLTILDRVLKKKLILFGIGFRSWTYKTNDLKNKLILKLGFSRDISIEVPKSITLICLKPTLILLKSIDKSRLSQFTSLVKSLKKPDMYKGKGIQYMNEKIKLKLGKNN